MSPSVIVLNACAAFFLALTLIFFTYLIARYRKLRQQQTIATGAKEIPLFKEKETEPVLQQRVKYKFAEAE